MNIDISRAWITVQEWINGLIAILPNLIIAVLAFFFFYWVGKGVRHFIEKLTRRYQRSQHVSMVVGRLVHGIIGVVGFFIGLTITFPSITAAQLVSALGVSSIAIGFAFKEILQNFLAGILILLTQPFKIGDRVVITGYEGTVMNIETRATTLKTYDNFLVVIPNAVIFTSSITVLTALGRQRTQHEFTIKFGQDIEKAKKIVEEAAADTEGVLEQPPPDTLVTNMTDGKITILGRWWNDVQQTDWLRIRDQVIAKIRARFDEEELDIAPKERTAGQDTGDSEPKQ